MNGRGVFIDEGEEIGVEMKVGRLSDFGALEGENVLFVFQLLGLSYRRKRT